jgi:hypothetical protein
MEMGRSIIEVRKGKERNGPIKEKRKGEKA